MGERRACREGETLEGKGQSGGQDCDCMKELGEDLNVLGRKYEAAHEVGRCFRQVKEVAGVFVRKWHKAGEEATAGRHMTAATATLVS